MLASAGRHDRLVNERIQDAQPNFRLGKLDTEAEQKIAGRHGIHGIPTMILFSSGKEIARTSGAMPTAQIAQWARSHV
ncbi:thioredoxin family protein [Paracoccus sp. TK19116]|uniref:Thioredoxin family protein n=1 Tax=Paracoccus albicereus TaxID=2922394 RepID=A0ABT1MS03_9RHOB|nr:thioredoxin family protein [Paracoccus albicereus]MCQ0970128.1 thioredoxin family protein [Paracoccus albicereus]